MTILTENIMDLSQQQIASLSAQIEQRLDELLPLPAEREKVSHAMRAGTLAPGKRIRPLLLLLTAQDLGYCGSFQSLLDTACAVEMIHAASLILDDMPCMDNATLRRNQPAIHCQFGEPVALLAVVALVSKAFGLIAATEGLSADIKTLAINELSQAIGVQGLVQGQFQDLTDGGGVRSAEAISMTNHFKTSTLFCAASQMAAVLANANPSTREHLRHFSFNLGQAFQLLDDLHDHRQDTGKDCHQDQGKSTLVNLLGSATVEKRLRAHLLSAQRHLGTACHKNSTTQTFLHAWFEKKLTVAG